MPKILITAGDISGDAHAAKLMRELKKLYTPPGRLSRDGKLEFVGIGGEKMKSEGLDSIVDLKNISIVGFWEVIKNYRFIKSVFNKCKSIIDLGEFSLFIPVDYPGFNIRLAGYAKNKKIPVIYYIAPQIWAWGKNRAKKLTKSVDKLLVVFPFEEEFFKSFGINAEYVGHPLLENNKLRTEDTNIKLGNEDDTPTFTLSSGGNREAIIAFFPGSRMQEVKRHTQLINRIAYILNKKLQGYRFAVAVSPLLNKEYYTNKLDKNIEWEFSDDSIELMKKANAGIVKTGTSTLEAALCGMPFCMFYKTSLFNYLTGKALVKLKYISLVNILLNKPVINEYVQGQAEPDVIANDVIDLLSNNVRYKMLQSEFDRVRQLLGGIGASKKAAEVIINNIND